MQLLIDIGRNRVIVATQKITKMTLVLSSNFQQPTTATCWRNQEVCPANPDLRPTSSSRRLAEVARLLTEKHLGAAYIDAGMFGGFGLINEDKRGARSM